MLNEDACTVWMRRLGLPAAACQLIATIRATPPSRRVRSGTGNVPCRFPSAKMGHVIQAESHTVELPFVYAAERDPDVLEYWDQPGKIRLAYRSATGRPIVGHTPDFFELRHDSAGWVECKPEDRLWALTRQAPHRYCRTTEGQWRCPPGEAYAAQYDLTYRIFSSAAINAAAQRNWLFLADYLRADCPAVDTQQRALVCSVVEREPGLTLAQLYERVRPLVGSDAINTLVATAGIYVDLQAGVLAEPETVAVFRDAATAQAYAHMAVAPVPRTLPFSPPVALTPGRPLRWDGQPWTAGSVTATHISVTTADGVPLALPPSVFDGYVRDGRITGVPVPQTDLLHHRGHDMLVQARAEDLAVANRRYAVIKPYLEGRMPVSVGAHEIARRTAFRWIKRWRDAEATHGNGYLGLLPASRCPHAPHRLLTETHLALLHTILDQHYATYRHKKLRRSYGPFLLACGEQGLHEVSERTFYTEAHRYLGEHAATLARAGRRAAYASQPPQLAPEARSPRHGDRPWELAHIDHTELDLELRSARTGRNLGRAWLTLLVDAFTRRILVVYVTYARPSAASCMMALRLCVQRWGRLPRILVTDGGPEFHSTYFETLLAWYKVTLKTRPPAEPKYGAVCERLFGTANSTFIHTLLGNTQVMQHVRQVTRAVNPKTHACWTLGDLHTWLCAWAYEVYDTIDHPALGQSPRDASAWAEDRAGRRDHLRIPYDRDFVISTLPTTRKGTATVQPGHGVKINAILYWCSAFEDPELERTAVPVRYDPFDAGVAYAYLAKEQRWIECRSDYYALLQGRSQRELQLITEELRKAQRDHGARTTITAKQLAAFGARVEEHERVMLQRDRDAETRIVLTRIDGTALSPADVPLPTPAEHEVAVVQVPVPKPKLLPRLR
jgi:transposase InsO family protein